MKNIMPLGHLTATALLILTYPVFANEFLPNIQQQGSFYYITGGIGAEETQAMKSERDSYNLQIMNADKSGHFTANQHIRIIDKYGNVLINADSDPLFYTNLPAGKYTVEASRADETKMNNITISGRETAAIRFVWK